MKDPEHHHKTKPEQGYDTHYHYNHEDGVNTGQAERRHMSSMTKLEDITMLRRTPSNSNNV